MTGMLKGVWCEVPFAHDSGVACSKARYGT
jgi:hypothetical protein